MAKVVAIGQPANESERGVIALLRDHLPDGYTVLHNLEIRAGNQAFEIDLVVIAPHAIYLADVKSTAGEIHVHAGKWYPEGRPAFASPLYKLRQHAKVIKTCLVGSPERPEMKKVWVDAVVILTEPGAYLNDPAGIDAPTVTNRENCAAYFQDIARLPSAYKPAPNLALLSGRITTELTGCSRPPPKQDIYGDWRIEERLGGTSFYTEYRAFNRFAGPSAGHVSLRVYETDPYLSPEEREQQGKRIATAYTALNRLPTHPAIPLAKSFFQDESTGRYILVTEEAPGKALRLHLKKVSMALTMDQKIRVVCDVLSALAHLHDHGVLHRAINPGTVIVGPDGQTRLTDFDFAQAGPDRSFTLGEQVYEKAEDDAYLAPEIYLNPAQISSAADVYAAATVFYEIFTGEKMFHSLKEAVDAGCRIPEPASQKNQNLPAGFDAWLQAMCALEPTERADARTALQGFDALFAPAPQEETTSDSGDSDSLAPVDYNNLPAGYALTHTYIVEKRLGKPGAFGVAYKVIDILGDVARVVKIVVKDRNSPIDRLKQEYQHLLRVPPHPNVVKVIHADYLPADGRPFIVFEFVDGMDVQEMIEKRTLSLPDALQLAVQAAQGLKHLHAQGITHCDIKPSNLLWTDQGVKIIDFNVSMLVTNPAARGGGSKKYLPPDLNLAEEQTEEVRCDRDLFALGVTFYQAVTGHYPWEASGVPMPGHSATDPRTFPDCSDLSTVLVEAILKSIGPHRANRFHTADEMLVALQAVKNPRQMPVSPPPTTLAFTWADLSGGGKPRPNFNPFVSYIKTIYSQNDLTNRGTKGMDTLGGKLYIETALDTHLAPAILEGGFRLVLITGNAGDGKTAFLQRLEQAARQRGEEVSAAPGGNGAIFRHRQRRFLSNYDGSQDEGDKVNDDVLLNFLGPYQGASEASWPDQETRIIAINEGRLVDFLEIHQKKFPLLRAIVTRGLRSCTVEHQVTVVNLNLRSVVASRGLPDQTIFDRLLSRFADPKFWSHCSSCDLRAKCYAFHNMQTMQDPTGGPQVRSRLRMLYMLTTLRGRLHITVRHLSSALAFMLTGARDCDEIHELYRNGSRPEILDGFYFNSWMGGSGQPADELLKLLQTIDVGSANEARIDRNLDYRNPAALPGLMDFEGRVGDYDRQVLQSIHESLPDDPGGNPKERINRHQGYVRAMRRLYYFECRDESWHLLLPYQSADRMLGLLTGRASVVDAIPRLIRAINRGEGLYDPNRLKGKLALQVRRVENGTIRCYRVFPENGFHLQVQTLGGECPYLETAPAGLLLTFNDTTSPAPARLHAEMAINLDVFEMLERLNLGYRPSVEEIQGFWLSLSVFKNVLSSAPYQEILLTSTGHDFYSVERDPDGKLTMALAETGGEYATAKDR